MVINGARSQLRRRRIRRTKEPERPGLVAAAEDSGVASMDRIGMLARIRRLPKKQSDVLILRYYVQLSEREIATTLGIAPGSVKSHASRALKKLRDEMKDDRP